MRTIVCILIVWICAVNTHAQSGFSWFLDNEGKIIALPKSQKKIEMNIPKTTYQSFSPFSFARTKSELSLLSPNAPLPSLTERPMDMHISSGAYQPFFNVYTPMLQKANPMSLDFCELFIKQINDRFDVIATGIQFTWGGIGGTTYMNSAISWHNDRWRLYAGGFGSRTYNLFNPHPDVTIGVNIQMDYQANDWLTLKTWGQYAHYDEGKGNPHFMANPYFSQSVVGGAFNIKVSDNFSFGVGFNYDYTGSQGKRNRSYLFYPNY